MGSNSTKLLDEKLPEYDKLYDKLPEPKSDLRIGCDTDHERVYKYCSLCKKYNYDWINDHYYKCTDNKNIIYHCLYCDEIFDDVKSKATKDHVVKMLCRRAICEYCKIIYKKSNKKSINEKACKTHIARYYLGMEPPLTEIAKVEETECPGCKRWFNHSYTNPHPRKPGTYCHMCAPDTVGDTKCKPVDK